MGVRDRPIHDCFDLDRVHLDTPSTDHKAQKLYLCDLELKFRLNEQ